MHTVWQSYLSVYLNWARRPLEGDRDKGRKGEEARIPGQWAAHLAHLQERRWHPLPSLMATLEYASLGKENVKEPLKSLAKIKLLHSSVFHGSDSSHRFLAYDSLYQTTGAPHLCPASVTKVSAGR